MAGTTQKYRAYQFAKRGNWYRFFRGADELLP